MALVAVLFNDDGGSDLGVGGITIGARQRRLVARLRPRRIIELPVGGATSAPHALGAAVSTAAVLAAEINESPEVAVTVSDSSVLAAAIEDDDLVLMIAPGIVLDERIVDRFGALAGPAVASWPSDVGLGLERLDAQALWAGIALHRGATVRHVIAGLGDWDLASTLLRSTLSETDVERIDLAEFPLYAPARRRDVPLVWARPETLPEARTTTNTIIASAQKGCLDWPAALIHPPIEDGLVRLLAPTPITPNMVTLFVLVLGVIAGAAFATGWLWTGLVLALLTGPLDGVDGKLARTRVEYSRFGDLEHILDKITEYGWFLCLAWYFSTQEARAGAWGLAMTIILFALAESLQGEFYRRFTGAQLDDAGTFERRFRVVSGRRNTFFWTFLPFAAAGGWFLGFKMIAAYSVITFFIMQTRLFIRLAAFGSAHSPRIAANFARTAYAFLPAAKRSAR